MIQETCPHNLWLLFEGLISQSLPPSRNPLRAGLPTLTSILPPNNSVCCVEVVPSSNSSIMDHRLRPMEKYFIRGGHRAFGDTRHLSAVDGIHLRESLKKRGFCGGQAFPQFRLRQNCSIRPTGLSWGQKDPTGRVNFIGCSPVLIFKLAFSKAVGFADPLYYRFAAEDSLVGQEDLGPLCSKYNISPW